MNIRPGKIEGTLPAIPAKAHAHRLLIAAALSDKPTAIHCPHVSEDILRTAECLHALCAHVERTETGFTVTPRAPSMHPLLNVGESGSTYRFLLPVACALQVNPRFQLAGRLPSRPMDALVEALSLHGMAFSGLGTDHVQAEGNLTGGAFSLPGDVSSQFVSGLLLAAPLLSGLTLQLTTPLESKGYVDITLDAMAQFGIKVVQDEGSYALAPGQGYASPGKATTEGDWSNAAFFLCAAAAGHSHVTLTGLSLSSPQGDKAIVEMLRAFGADVRAQGDHVSVHPAPLRPAQIDITHTPDLAPALAVVCAAAEGTSTLVGTRRLKLKESDRSDTIAKTLEALGGQVQQQENALLMTGTGSLTGGVCDSYNDHRIAMMAACLSVLAKGDISLQNPQAVSKSYPHFFEDFALLQGI